MDYITYEERLQYLLETAQKGRLLSLKQAARTFGCSNRTVKRMIYHLRFKGHNITYSHTLKKFTVKI